MLRIIIILAVIAVALLRGGSLRNFAALQLRWPGLAIAGLALQLLIFTPFASAPVVAFATLPLYGASIALLAAFVALNWRVPGMALIGAGFVMNIVAVAANGGHMPVDPGAARLAGKYDALVADDPQVSKHIIGAADQVNFWLLTDVIGIPEQIPFAVVWSIGDVVLTLGIAILCYGTIRRGPGWPTPRASHDRDLAFDERRPTA
jgi:hypothetical protein